MKRSSRAMLLTFALTFTLLCGCAATQQGNSTGAAAQFVAETLPYQEGLLVDTLSAGCQVEHVSNYIWLSEDEVILESMQYEANEKSPDFDVRWFVWNIHTGAIEELYRYQEETYNEIAQVKSLPGDEIDVLLFGGQLRKVKRASKTLLEETRNGEPEQDPLTTYYDLQTGTLFFFEDQQMKMKKDGAVTSLYTLSENNFPRTLTVSPDKTTLAFSSVTHDAFVGETVIVDLNSGVVKTISKGMVMPYYGWLDNNLCAVENRDEGDTIIYYGEELAEEVVLEYPVPGSGYLYFESSAPNLGEQRGYIPVVREYRAADGEWLSEAGILEWKEEKPVIQMQILLHNEGIAHLALSPQGQQLLLVHSEAFTGKNEALTIASLQH